MSYKGINYHNIFAPKEHKHDDKYAQIIHDHDDKYSKLTHNHDSKYLIKGNNVSLPRTLTFTQNGGVVYGTTTTGEIIEAFNVCGADNSLAIGWGGQSKLIGVTKIFGDRVNINSNNVINFNKQIKAPHFLTGDNKPAFLGDLKTVYNSPGGYFRLGGLMIAYGKADITGIVANTIKTHAVTFPKEFTLAPMVSLTKNSGAPEKISIGAGSVTTTGFNINFMRTNTTDTTIFWLAIGACN